jgi:hypothetical protein
MMQIRQFGFVAGAMNMFSFSAAPARRACYTTGREIGARTQQHARGKWAHQQTWTLQVKITVLEDISS